MFKNSRFRKQPNCLPSSGVQVVDETAGPLSRCYILHFKGVKYFHISWHIDTLLENDREKTTRQWQLLDNGQ
jgi:membrane protein YdbS with pleckstrin-like domain